MTKAGVPADSIKGMTAFCHAIAQGEFDSPDKTLEKLIGRKPQSMKEFLKIASKL
jgi:NAD(P)H dehydrogenase (quinone)